MNAPETLQASAADGHADTFASHFEEADTCVSQASAIANLLANDPDNEHANAAWAMRDLLDRAGAAINAMQRKHSAMDPVHEGAASV